VICPSSNLRGGRRDLDSGFHLLSILVVLS